MQYSAYFACKRAIHLLSVIDLSLENLCKERLIFIQAIRIDGRMIVATLCCTIVERQIK